MKIPVFASAFLLLGATAIAAVAQPPAPALLVPRPADKPDGDYGPYLTYPEMQAKIAEWARTHPELVQVSSLGKTFEGTRYSPRASFCRSRQRTGFRS